MVITYKYFIKTFKNIKCHSLLEVDLSNTHYYKHLDKIRKNIEDLSNLAYTPIEMVNDNLHLFARYYDYNGNNTVIMAHGYSANSFNNFHASIKSFISHGYNVLLIDERAHNDSEGTYTTMGIREQYDILKWITWVETNTETKSIILYGVSMGSATIGYLSNKLTNTKVKALVMDCGFTSFYDELFYQRKNKKLNFLVLFFFRLYGKIILHVDIKTSTLDSLKETNIPVYFIHGLLDEMVPVEHTIANYNITSSPKRVRYVANAGHTTSFLIDYDYLDKDLFDFLNKYL